MVLLSWSKCLITSLLYYMCDLYCLYVHRLCMHGRDRRYKETHPTVDSILSDMYQWMHCKDQKNWSITLSPVHFVNFDLPIYFISIICNACTHRFTTARPGAATLYRSAWLGMLIRICHELRNYIVNSDQMCDNRPYKHGHDNWGIVLSVAIW